MSYKYEMGGGGGGYDYASLMKSIFGSGQRPNGGGNTFLPNGAPTNNMAMQQAGIINSHMNGSGNSTMSIPTMDPTGAAELRAFKDNAPYLAQQQMAATNHGYDMEKAQVAARIQMAQMQMQQQMASEQRRNDLELQRRNALQGQYTQAADQYNKYGIS